MNGIREWQECQTPEMWDDALANLGGHPLQSMLWGNARQKIEGISQTFLEYRASTGQVTGLARVEERSIPFLGKIAWLPKGPVLPLDGKAEAKALLLIELKQREFVVGIEDEYTILADLLPKKPKTIWLDLTLGLEKLSKNLDSQWRYGSKRALREGVIVRQTCKPTEISEFFRLCTALSVKKGFSLPGSDALIQELIQSTSPAKAVGTLLYVADINGIIAGGAVVMRCGRHLHYFWGASDRRFSKYRVNEAIHWQIMEDGVTSGMVRYDLEGIDPARKSGVYRFKRKMGGSEVALAGMEATPLSWAGHILVKVGRRLGRF